MKKLLIFTAIIITITACEKEKLDNGHGANMIVIQGYLYAGKPVDSLRLSQTVLLNSADTLFHGITDATVTIKYNGINYKLTAILNMPSYYQGDPSFIISSGQTYALKINYNNDTITSQTVVPTYPSGFQISDTILTIDTTLTSFRGISDTSSVLVSWNNPNKDYYFIILTYKDSTLKPITFISTNPRTGVTAIDTVRGSFTRRLQSSPIQTSSYKISASSMSSYGNYEFKLYKVTKDYANLYQSRTQSTINLNEPFTNINNGLGIFTSFSADSLSFKVVKKIQ
jgi:hypothetical protein